MYLEPLKASLWVLALGVSVSPSLRCQESGEETERGIELVQEGFRAEVVYPQARRELQGTLAFDYRRDPGVRFWTTSLLLEFGLTDRIQLSGGVPFRGERIAPGGTETGLGRPEAGLLVAVWPGLDPLALSVEVEAGFPSLDGEEDGVEWGGTIIGALRAGGAQIHASLGVEVEDGEANPAGGLIGIYPAGNWRFLVEASGYRDGATVAFLTPGVMWQVMEGFELGAGLPIPITAAAPGTNLVVKLTLETRL